MKYEEIIKLKDRIILTTDGGYPTSVFKDRFSNDRYLLTAVKKANDYGDSLHGTIVEVKGGQYKIIDHYLMMGSCGYVGSLTFVVQEIFQMPVVKKGLYKNYKDNN